MAFRDRQEAGQILAEKLAHYRGRDDLLVLALPRGGVPVAFEVAKSLEAPLDICVVRKLGVPGASELAMGAVASGGARVLNSEVIVARQIPRASIDAAVAKEEREIARQEQIYRHGRPALPIADHLAILIDDGLATGATMRAAARAIRQHNPKGIVAAVPVGAAETCRELREEFDEAICAAEPEAFRAVGLWYEDFLPTSDQEVMALLDEAAGLWHSHASGK